MFENGFQIFIYHVCIYLHLYIIGALPSFLLTLTREKTVQSALKYCLIKLAIMTKDNA